ncbi:hypothetical protein HKD37_09G024725 [Glycine soja]
MISMATPPSSPPPPTEAASQSSSLVTRPAGADRLVVHVDPATGKADGPHKKKLRTYLGIFARDKVNVTYENWKQVPTAQKDLIWEDIQDKFDIPEASDVRTKKKVLQTVGERWRLFKSDLTSKWTLAADKDSVNDTVCEKYGISKEKWTQFCQSRRDPSWEDVRKKAQAIQKQNTAPHMLSRGGYEYLEKKLMAKKTKKKLEEVAQSGSIEAVIDRLSPIRRHVKWKMARMKKTGQMMSETAKEIAEKIVRFIGGASFTRFFCPSWMSGCPDCCHWVTRTPWLCACCWSQCDHQAILWISSTDLPHFFFHGSRRTRVVDSTNQGPVGGVDHKKGLPLPLEPEVGPSATRVSTRESCVDPSGNDPNTGDSDKYGLYIEENPPRLGSTTFHNIPLLHDQVNAGVEEVKDADASVHVPTDEVNLVGQTFNTFLALPTHLVKRLSEQGAVGPTKLADRPNHEVMWDTTVFGVFNQDFPLYIKHEDLSKIAHGDQCLNISVIQLWILHLTEISMRAGNSNVYGFLEPQSIQRSGQSQFESESYMKNWMPDNYLKGIINSALKGLEDTPQPEFKAGAMWIVVKCNRQKGSIECGYYVMHWMSTIILGSFTNNWKMDLRILHNLNPRLVLGELLLKKKGSIECDYYVMHCMSTIILGSFRNNWETIIYFNDVRPLEAKRLKTLRILWANYYLKVRNQI